MRVIAGIAKGRPLKGPPRRSRGTRPSSDMLRGAVFSALESMGADISRVLDLYAGSGALGVEALSRGAGWCDFVERQPSACQLIRQNLRATGFDEQANVYCIAVERVLSKLGTPYTLILADPPYSDVGAEAALQSLAASPLVEAGQTVLVLEHSARAEAPSQIGPLSLAKQLRHGDGAVSIYR